MKLSTPTLNLLAVLLSQVSLPANDPEIEAKAKLIAEARRELLAALEERGKEEEAAVGPFAKHGPGKRRK